MSIALESAQANHNLWGEEYLHYYLEHAPEAISWAQQMASLTKTQNTIGMRSNMRARVNDVHKGLAANSNLTKRQIENFLEGKYLKSIQEVSETALTGSQEGGVSGFEEAIAIIKDIDIETSTLQDFSDKVRLALNNAYNDANLQEVYSQYAKELVQEYADTNNLASTPTKLSNNIIQDILAKNNHRFFKLQGEKFGVNTAITKILALIESIPNMRTKGNVVVKHGETSTTVSGRDNVLEALKNKIVSYFSYAEKITLEYTLAQGLVASNHRILKKLIDNGGMIAHTGGKNVTTNFHIDENMKREYELSELYLSRTQQKTAKSDVTIYSQIDNEGNGVVTGSAGFTVKDYGGVEFIKEKKGVYSVQGDITLQSGTPLLTALMREANMSYESRRKMVQYLVGQDAGAYNHLWEDIKKNLANRMFLNALAGLRGADSTLFICLNGKIFSLTNFVDSFISSPDSMTRISEYLGESNELSAQNGLIRSTYQDMNRWLGTTENLYLAKTRSKVLEQRVYQKLGATKLKISVNLAKMGGLVQLNR